MFLLPVGITINGIDDKEGHIQLIYRLQGGQYIPTEKSALCRSLSVVTGRGVGRDNSDHAIQTLASLATLAEYSRAEPTSGRDLVSPVFDIS